MDKLSCGFYQCCGKRWLDLFITIPGLIALYPLIFLLSFLVRIKLGQPVFFCQIRPGFHGAPFTLFKFRTMTNQVDERGNLLPDSQRFTGFGKFLRSSSLDELPELWNVLKGEMSLVGPRPLLMRYVPYFTARERKRMDVLPGITGSAQITGRNELPWTQRLELDVKYTENLSLFQDLKILALTFFKVFKKEGFVEDPQTIMKNLDEERAT